MGYFSIVQRLFQSYNLQPLLVKLIIVLHLFLNELPPQSWYFFQHCQSATFFLFDLDNEFSSVPLQPFDLLLLATDHRIEFLYTFLTSNQQERFHRHYGRLLERVRQIINITNLWRQTQSPTASYRMKYFPTARTNQWLPSRQACIVAASCWRTWKWSRTIGRWSRCWSTSSTTSSKLWTYASSLTAKWCWVPRSSTSTAGPRKISRDAIARSASDCSIKSAWYALNSKCQGIGTYTPTRLPDSNVSMFVDVVLK